MANITIKNLCKAFGTRIVLENFDAVIAQNELTIIMGASGCGKTTILNILMGLEKVDSGEITGILGKQISAVFQENRLCEHLNAVQNIKLVTANNYTTQQILFALAKVLVDNETANKPVCKLSGGQKRRVSIVRAMLAKSDIILMDEPFKGLDANTKTVVIDFVKSITQGKTVVVVTHDIAEFDGVQSNLIKMGNTI